MTHDPPAYGGRRYHRITRLSRGIACTLLSAIVLSFLGYGSVIHHWEGKKPLLPADPRPTPDELLSSSDELNAEYRDFLYENEYPMALGVYDQLFAQEDGNVPNGELKIVKTDLSKNPSLGTIYVKNNTDYTLKALDFLSADTLTVPAVSQPADANAPPLVLIYHTHGTEAYAEEGVTSYAKKDLPRSRKQRAPQHQPESRCDRYLTQLQHSRSD